MGISLFFLFLLSKLAEKKNWKTFKSGLYFEFYVKDGKLKSRLNLLMYVNQLLSWVFIGIFSKIILAFIQLNLHSLLEFVGWAVLFPVKDNPKLKLVLVMVVCPVTLNSIQFWVTDNFLKLKKEVYPQLEVKKSNQLQYEKEEKEESKCKNNNQNYDFEFNFESIEKNNGKFNGNCNDHIENIGKVSNVVNENKEMFDI
jgi:hypothetical protein